MCFPPGEINTWPLKTLSPFSASLTVTLQFSFKRWANCFVNISGICCTITIPGQSEGNPSKKTLKASVPPVDAPTAITVSVVWTILLDELLLKIASAVNFGATSAPVRAKKDLFLTFESAAAFTLSQSSILDCSSKIFVLIFGLANTSTAPYSKANRAESVPFSVNVEITTTGIGCWDIIFFKNVNPSILGISISSVITSGTHSLILSTAI